MSFVIRLNVVCDVVDIDVCHLLLGRPRQFDVDTVHKGRDNVYKFWWNSKKIHLLSLTDKKKNRKAETKNFFCYCEGTFRRRL